MEHIKKVIIAIKLGLTTIMETFWAIGTSIVAGDVLLRQKARNANQGVQRAKSPLVHLSHHQAYCSRTWRFIRQKKF